MKRQKYGKEHDGTRRFNCNRSHSRKSIHLARAFPVKSETGQRMPLTRHSNGNVLSQRMKTFQTAAIAIRRSRFVLKSHLTGRLLGSSASIDNEHKINPPCMPSLSKSNILRKQSKVPFQQDFFEEESEDPEGKRWLWILQKCATV